jgi:iron complex outermembrane receptor protein
MGGIRMKIFVLFITACLKPSLAVVAAEDVHTLQPVTVVAEGMVSPEQNVRTVDLTTEQKPVAGTVPDALDKAAGIDIQRRSVLTPKSSQVRIRGLEERRSLILLDGRPLNGTGVMGCQFVDWSLLAVENWQAAEIGKGAFTARYGNTLGGTINLVPAYPPVEPTFSIVGGFKRYDTYSGSAAVAGRLGSFGARLAAAYVETSGNLRNSEAERSNFSGDFYWFWGEDGEVRLSARYTQGDFNMPVRNDKDLPGYDSDYPESTGSYLIGPGIAFPAGDTHGDGSFYTKERTELDLSVKKLIAGFDSEWKLYFNNEDRTDRIDSYNQDVKVLEREATPDRSWGWLAHFSKPLGDHRLGFGADANYQGYGGAENTFVLSGYFPKPPMDVSDEWDATRYHGAFVDDTWTIRSWLSLYAGLRYEDYFGDRSVDQVVGYNAQGKPTGFETTRARFDENTLLPKFGVTLKPLEHLTVFGHAARATRFPDNPAFFWYFGGYRPEVDPNSGVVRKNLTFEDALQYEAGLHYAGIPRTALTLTWYRYRVDDYIRWIFGYAPSRVVYNVDRVDLQGVELEAQTRIGGPVTAFGNVAWQDTKKEGDVLDASNHLTDELSELPKWKVNLGIKAEWAQGFLAKATLRWVDDREVPYLGTPGAPFAGSSSPEGAPLGSNVTLQKMDAFAVVDLLLRVPVLKGHVQGFVTAGVENLFDESYEEELDFPAPGQTFFAAVELKF